MSAARWILGSALLAAAVEPGVRLVRTYPADATQGADLSRDGALLATHGRRKSKCAGSPCWQDVFTTYRTATGAQVAEYVGGIESGFSAVATDDGAVQAFDWYKHLILRWNPSSGATERRPAPPRFSAVHIFSDGRTLGIVQREGSPGLELAVADGESIRRLNQPALALNPSPKDLAHWFRGNHVLIESNSRSTLTWISVSGAPPIHCATLPESILGYAVSPDGFLIVVITGLGSREDGVFPPTYQTFMRILDGKNCAPLSSLPLTFPETTKRKAPLLFPKNQYFAPARMDLPHQVAVSPDRRLLAIGYGVRTDGIYSDSIAYVGLYAMKDGQRLATLREDTFQNGWIEALRLMDNVATASAPVGRLRFSPDSKTLYGSSYRVRQWDLTSLP